MDHFLLGFLPDHQISNRDCFYGYDPEFGVYLQHVCCRWLSQQVCSQALWRQYFKFTVVRNPYTRLLSVYVYCKRWLNCQESFSSFVLSLPTRVKDPRSEIGSFFTPQVEFSHIDGECVVDYVGRFESLSETVETVRNKLGIEREFPHLNAGLPSQKEKPIQTFYTQDMIEVVNQVYARDFEAFDYSML